MKETGVRLAVVLARGGSKGFPGKNVALLHDRPLVGWSIEHAMGSTLVDHVVVSSDGQEILDVARSMGVAIVERGEDVSNDSATVDAAARFTVLQWEAEHGELVSHVAILYGNVPLRPHDLTDRALAKLAQTGADSVQSVYRVGKMHPYWMKKLEGDRLVAYEENEVYRRQDLPPVYMLDGGIIAVTRASLFQEDPAHPHAFLGMDRRAIETREGEVVDVDAPIDLTMATSLLSGV